MRDRIRTDQIDRFCPSFFSVEVSVADVIGTPSVCKVRVFRTPGQIISLTSDFSFVRVVFIRFVLNFVFYSFFSSLPVIQIRIIFMCPHRSIVLLQHRIRLNIIQRRTPVTIDRSPHHVWWIVVYVSIVNLYLCVFRKMKRCPSVMKNSTNMTKAVPAMLRIFSSVAPKDVHPRLFKLSNNRHGSIRRPSRDC